MNSINCIIVDDEPLAVDIIKGYVEKIPYLELKATLSNAWELNQYLQNNRPELILLDINMPGLDGITLLKSLQHFPPVIFITAHRNFAVEAFELQAFDYLLKPVSFDRFLEGINKYNAAHRKSLQQGDLNQAHSIFILSDRKMIKINFDEINYIEAKGDYLRFVKSTGKPILTKMTLKLCADKLPDDQFRQIHRSFIINKNNIKAYTQDKVQVGEEWLKVSRSYKNNFNC